MSARRWFEQPPPGPISKPRAEPVSPAKDLWVRCDGCGEVLYRPDLPDQHQVCHHCGHHFRMGALARILMLADPDTWKPVPAGITPIDPLGFVDSKPYDKRLEQSQAKTGAEDAFISGSCTIDGLPIEIGSFDFRFMGGSMGSVVGELITRLYERALAQGRPAVVISASGGARMQEGALSLMQMAKSCAALARLREAGLPYISVLTHPTTGGVAASFAMLGDVILAEPNALIGFAGPRVIEQTIGESLPEGFQTTEYLLEHGMLDRVVPRGELRSTLSILLHWMAGDA